jgi:hypothetical protein
MEIILFVLLLGVWAALVVPSVVRSRRERAVTPRSSTPGAPARRTADHRARVLARRKTALIVIVVAVVGTLVLAILLGSWPLLALSLVIDVVLAAYIAILLQIKQRKAGPAPPPAPAASDPDVRVRTP